MTAAQRRERTLCVIVMALAAAVILYVFVHLVVAVSSPPASNPSPRDWAPAAGTTVPIVPAETTPSSSIVVAESEQPPATLPASERVSVWDRLADCESGEWDRFKRPIPGSARWADQRGGYEGGVHFAPGAWDAFKLAGYPDAAYLATREQQITVASRVLAAQGWGAWPVCSYKVGAR